MLYQSWSPVTKGILTDKEYRSLSIKETMMICYLHCDVEKDKAILRDYLMDIHDVNADDARNVDSVNAMVKSIKDDVVFYPTFY